MRLNALSKPLGIALVVSIILGILVVIIPLYFKPAIPEVKSPQSQEEVTSPQLTLPQPLIPPSEEQKGDQGVYTALISRINSYAKLSRRIANLMQVARGALPVEGAVVGIVQEPSSTTPSQTEGYSKTNVQVYGIDEHDIVKTDGKAIYVGRDTDVILFDAVRNRVASKLILPSEWKHVGLYAINNRLVILASSLTSEPALPRTLVYVVNVEDLYRPVLIANFTIDGAIQGSRLKYPFLYVVTLLPAFSIVEENNTVYVKPRIPTVNGRLSELENIKDSGYPPRNYVTVFSLDLENLAWSTVSVLMNNVERIYMSSSNLYIVGSVDKEYLAFEIIVSKALEVLPADVVMEIQKCLDQGDYLGAFEALLIYIENLSNEEQLNFITRINEKLRDELLREITSRNISIEIPREWLEYWRGGLILEESLIAVLDVNELSIKLKGFIKVEGRILDQFAIEEFKINNEKFLVLATTSTIGEVVVLEANREIAEYKRGDLADVVAKLCSLVRSTYECKEIVVKVPQVIPVYRNTIRLTRIPLFWFSSNNVYVVKPDELKIISVLEKLAPGERVYAARLINKTFYLVTFRTVDPLYAIDLSTPEKPVILGYLKMPGFSEYLHPVSNDLLVGVGREDRYVKISLFDARDPTNIIERSTLTIGWSSPVVDKDDYHAFLFDERYMVCYIPLTIKGYGKTDGIIAVFIDLINRTIKPDVKFLDHVNAIRVVYIEDRLYTVSKNSIRTWSLPVLELISETPLE
ncbi:MAG: beta-propeller domain-containing protein [Desulfurococcaceae archaeon]